MRRVLTSVMVATLGLASAASAAATYNLSGGNFSYTENFEGWSLDPYAAPNGTAASDYWTSTGEHWYANNYWGSGYRLWNATMGASDSTASLNLANIPATSGLTLTNVTVKAEVAFSQHADWWNGANTHIWLLNATGYGYTGKVTSDGILSLYTVKNGVISTTLVSAGGNHNEVVSWDNSNISHVLGLSVINGVVTLTLSDMSNNTLATISTNDITTASFTNIGIQGHYGVSEQHNIDNVSINGTVVPEAASLGLLGLGGLSLLRRSRR